MERLRILLVDDEKPVLEILQLIIESKTNYICESTSSGDYAIEYANKNKPDLIVLDVNMPKMDGYQLCEKLKQSEQTKDIPIIFLTARLDTKSKIKAFESGAAD